MKAAVAIITILFASGIIAGAILTHLTLNEKEKKSRSAIYTIIDNTGAKYSNLKIEDCGFRWCSFRLPNGNIITFNYPYTQIKEY